MSYMILLEKNFDTFDRNHNGWLNKNEIMDGLIRFGFSASYADDFMQKVDQNKDGKITRAEFLEAAKKIKSSDITEAQIRSVFKKVDLNHDGQIDANELQTYLKTQHNIVSMDQVNKWIVEFDKNKNEKLNYEEFLTFIRSKLK